MRRTRLFRTYLSSVCVVFLLSIASLIAGVIGQELYNSSSPPRIASVQLSELNSLNALNRQGIPLLSVDRANTSAVVEVSAEQYTWLLSMGFQPVILPDDLAVNQGWKLNPAFTRDFHNYAQMTTELQTIATTYPAITRLYDLGQSVQARTIWGLKITDNPDDEEDEPEVRICGLHHGNELMSGEMPLLLAQYLTQNYGSNATVTTLVNTREIWIIPMVNPDGREANTRYNANGVDLNRDYGYMWGDWGATSGPFSQPETQIIRENALDNPFVLSLSFHTSGDIVNYIWNYKHQRCPDNDVVEYLSNQYGSHNGYWVVEGYDWYQTMGDTNDFSYGCRGDIDWTIEVQNSNIPDCWNKNREAMFDILQGANLGLCGIVTSAQTRQPLAATVWVEEAYWPCFTDPLVGDYHKPLLPGTYHVTVRANGYQDKESTVVVAAGQPTYLNVSLNPAYNYYAYQITVAEYHAPSDNFANNPTEAIAALGPPDDSYASLGVSGNIIVDMRDDITDRPDAPDFKVYEGDSTVDGYHVYGSSTWNGPWTDLGLAMGTTTFDLASASLPSVRYLKIVDDGDGSPYEQNPGCDIDAVENLAAAGGNFPPNTPAAPAGPTSGQAHVEYSYTTSTVDPEAEQVYYQWSWGDSLSGWLGPYDSGATVTATHAWMLAGNYTVNVKAKDPAGSESGWSDAIIVSIESAPHIEIGDISGGFGVTAIIANIGAGEATNVQWTIILDGGLVLLGRQTIGTLVKIQPGFSPQVHTDLVLGLGTVTITVTADSAEKTASAFLLGPFILIRT